MMSTTPPQGPGVRAETIFPGGASIFDPGHEALWRPLFYHPASEDPSSHSGYLHPSQLLESGFSCLLYPTLFLLRSQLALSLSPLALLLFLQWKNCWLQARGRAAHRDTLLHGTLRLCSGVPVPGHLPTGSVTCQVVRLVFFNLFF